MTKVTCDLCGCELARGEEARETNVKLLFFGPTFDMDGDFCISCGTRVYNKLRSFIAEETKKEQEANLSARW